MRIVRDPANPLAVGDLLRLTYESTGVSVLMALQSITSVTPSPPATPLSNATANRAVWLLSFSKDPCSPAN